ncbi:protein DOWNY MILDEW RESISTANCE 6-like [Durio zibethinus]|uniref:Protein DOWNY MILDEW RESISTANCE 6-like n=1 Tax=Durio zibethinus TaxID=66656 RepID=A0A6P6BEX1_DURZI|nr:protein DOWNY MILDEW RESISTANCE 6-like [Durio zibethinus]
METPNFLLANGSSSLSLTPKYILPQDNRPNLSEISTLASIPIIDLMESSALVVDQISKACEEFGFLQIINHGVPLEICDRMMAVTADFFELPPEEKAPFFTTDHTKQVKLFNYYIKDGSQNKVCMWSECFSHPWHPLDDILHLLPQNPPQYRDVVVEYAKEIGVLMKRLLSLISQGLGLEKDCLEKNLCEKPILRAQGNYYPPCPDPELTLGLNVHTDLNALTIVRQSEGVTGLQVIKDGEWVAVEPIPNAFVINLGDQIQVLSNGRYKSAHHRAVTNKTQKRVSVAMFYAPSRDAIIGPIQDLIDEQHPPLYREYRYSEFLEEFYMQEGTRRMVKEIFELKNYSKE